MLLTTAVCLALAAQDVNQRIEKMIADLASTEASVREKAGRELVEIGVPAVQAVEKSLASAKNEGLKAELQRIATAIREVPEAVKEFCKKQFLDATEAKIELIVDAVLWSHGDGYRLFATTSNAGVPCGHHFRCVAWHKGEKSVEAVDSAWLVKHIKACASDDDMKSVGWLAFNLAAEHSSIRDGILGEETGVTVEVKKTDSGSEAIREIGKQKLVIAKFSKERALTDVVRDRCMRRCTCGCVRSAEMIDELRLLEARPALERIDRSLAEIARREKDGALTESMRIHREQLRTLAEEIRAR
jgi:hypothetical protein